MRDPAALDRVPESARQATAEHFPLSLTPAFIRRVSGDDLSIPDIRTPADLAIVEKVSARFPALASPEGWGAVFSRELNATDDRRYFQAGTGALPVVEGKHLAPFRADLDACDHHSASRTPRVSWIPRGRTGARVWRTATWPAPRTASRSSRPSSQPDA